jgi:hypothetical protein
MQARLKRVSTLIRCSKLSAKAWIVGLSSAIFSNNGRYSYNTHLNALNIKIQCVLTLFKIFKPFISMISPNLISFKCLFGELEQYLYNNCMTT